MLFYLHEPSWILVIQRNLQTVDALYASLQIRCTAHNLRIAGFTIYKIIYQKARLFLSMCIAVHNEFIWHSQRQSEKVNIRNACVLPLRRNAGVFAF